MINKIITMVLVIFVILGVIVPSQSHDVCNDIDTAACEVYDVTQYYSHPVVIPEVKEMKSGVEIVTTTPKKERDENVDKLLKVLENPMTDVVMSVLILLAVLALSVSVMLEIRKRNKP